MILKVGDKIKTVRSVGIIKEILYVRGASVVLVTRQDTGKEDVWVFNNYQLGISVWKESN